MEKAIEIHQDGIQRWQFGVACFSSARDDLCLLFHLWHPKDLSTWSIFNFWWNINDSRSSRVNQLIDSWNAESRSNSSQRCAAGSRIKEANKTKSVPSEAFEFIRSVPFRKWKKIVTSQNQVRTNGFKNYQVVKVTLFPFRQRTLLIVDSFRTLHR